MITLIFSLILATVIGIGASAYYGAENLWLHPWVEQSTWFLIAAGMSSTAARWAYSGLKGRTRLTTSSATRLTRDTHETT